MFFYYPSLAQNKTPDYWKCNNKSGGSWNFGRAPNVCDVDQFIDASYVSSVYGPAIFDDSKEVTVERARYMSEVYGLIKDTARYYIVSRKPEVSEEEILEFIQAAYAIGHQESYWSHYRIPSNKRFQYMRGDYGHGHGIFQVDDRWHFTAINQGRGANLILNMVYSLEEYYDAWQRAPSQSCVNGERDWRARARSAYSAYNGGASKICRFTNPKDKWARNDEGFRLKYDDRSWERYVDDLDREGYLNIECAYNEGENCKKGVNEALPRENTIYRSSSLGSCVFKNDGQEFFCSSANEACLFTKLNGSSSSYSMGVFKDFWDEYQVQQVPDEGLCSEISGIYSAGTALEVLKNINVRKTPAGEKIGVIKSGSTSQIVGVDISHPISQDRYYKIVYGKEIGYIFAGNKSDFASWARQTQKSLTYKLYAIAGDYVKASDSLSSVDDETIDLEEGHVYQVVDSSVEGHKLFYILDVNGVEAKFYAGNFEAVNISDFFTLSEKADDEDQAPLPDDPKDEVRYGRLSKSIWWKKTYSCPATSCSKGPTFKGPKLTSSKLEISEEKLGWYKATQKGKTGWIQAKYVYLY